MKVNLHIFTLTLISILFTACSGIEGKHTTGGDNKNFSWNNKSDNQQVAHNSNNGDSDENEFRYRNLRRLQDKQ